MTALYPLAPPQGSIWECQPPATVQNSEDLDFLEHLLEYEEAKAKVRIGKKVHPMNIIVMHGPGVDFGWVRADDVEALRRGR